jgi:hypothetical protein
VATCTQLLKEVWNTQGIDVSAVRFDSRANTLSLTHTSAIDPFALTGKLNVNLKDVCF